MTPLQEARALQWAARRPLLRYPGPDGIVATMQAGLVRTATIWDPQDPLFSDHRACTWYELTPAGQERLLALGRRYPLVRARALPRGRHRLR